MRLAGAGVLVTGGSRGIGELVARGAAARGARVAVVARPSPALDGVAAALGTPAVPCDLSDPAARDGLVTRAEQALGGPVDVLVSAAGLDSVGGVLEVDAAHLRAVYETNLLAPAELARQALPGMVARGRGALAVVSSGYSTITSPGLAAYCSSKAGLSHLTEALRDELTGSGVDVVLVEPGPVRTAMYDGIEGHRLAGPGLARFRRLGVSRVVDPQEMADAVLDGIEAGAAHVVRPRRMVPVVACTWLPRAVARAVQTGLPKR